jgi:hypothetical protein
LDRELPSSALANDPHAESCTDCRERIAASWFVFPVLAGQVLPAQPSAGLTDRILQAVKLEQHVVPPLRFRRRRLRAVGALAACLVVGFAAYSFWPPTRNDTAQQTDPVIPAPLPESTAKSPPQEPAPALRLGEEWSKAENALLNTSRPITEPARDAPKLVAKLTDVLTNNVSPANEVGFSSQALAGIPDAARTGLEPVTQTTQKAFARLISDVSAIQAKAKVD